jgi:hypothetical protein
MLRFKTCRPVNPKSTKFVNEITWYECLWRSWWVFTRCISLFLGDFSFVRIFLKKLSCYHDNYFRYFMFGKYNGFVSKVRVSACMYFLVPKWNCCEIAGEKKQKLNILSKGPSSRVSFWRYLPQCCESIWLCILIIYVMFSINIFETQYWAWQIHRHCLNWRTDGHFYTE